jgi:hypothetical protein
MKLCLAERQPSYLVAVAVNDDNVAWAKERLTYDLVGRGCAVGDKESVLRLEGTRGLLVRILQGASRVKQRVEAAWG